MSADAVEPILSVNGLQVLLERSPRNAVSLVREASFDLHPGELVCLVGESGSGKSVTAMSVMGLMQRQKQISVAGSVRLHGRELVGADSEELRTVRGRELAMIFQDPMSSLDPVFTIEAQLVEALRRRKRLNGRDERERIVGLMRTVGISDPERCLRQYAHQLSGGMCQRVMIAMALASEPEVLIADEPTTALDVTIQAQILSLIDRLRTETGTAVLLITHDMGVAAQVADRVAVMYAGRVVEQGAPLEMFRRSTHPYTRGLLSCIPSVRSARQPLLPAIPGTVPDPSRLPEGCAFHPRCPVAVDACSTEDPPLRQYGNQAGACWRTAELLEGTLEVTFAADDVDASSAERSDPLEVPR